MRKKAEILVAVDVRDEDEAEQAWDLAFSAIASVFGADSVGGTLNVTEIEEPS